MRSRHRRASARSASHRGRWHRPCALLATFGLDVVDTDDVGTGGHSQSRRGECALESLIGGQIQDLADRRFAAGAQQDRAARAP